MYPVSLDRPSTNRRKKTLLVFGDDWPTPNGTCIRDYIHVTDLVESHIATINYLMSYSNQGLTVNLGTGGHAVFEIIHAFPDFTGRRIVYQVVSQGWQMLPPRLLIAPQHLKS